MSKDHEIPKFEIITNPDKPVPSGLGGLGLSRIVAVVPAFETPNESFFAYAQIPNKTLIRPLHKIEERALLLEVSIGDASPEAEADLDATVKNIAILANAWHEPENFLKLIYREQ